MKQEDNKKKQRVNENQIRERSLRKITGLDISAEKSSSFKPQSSD